MADPVWQDGVTPLNQVNMTKLQTRDEKGQPNGYASLDAGGLVPPAQIPVASGVPTGAGIDWFSATPPAGYLLCDGSAISRATYAALFAAISTTWGAGDGSTTFNLPDTRGRVLVGLSPGGHADVATIALNDGNALANRRPKHGHTNTLTLPNHVHSINDPGHAHEIPANGNAGSGPIVMQAIIAPDTGGNNTASSPTGVTVGNPTSNPVLGGSVGLAGPADTVAYAVCSKVIKT